MKNLILILLLAIPLCVCASKKRDDTPYLKGAVPMENGIVVFRKNFRIPAQSDKQIRDNMLYYVKDVLVANGMEGPVTRMLIGLTTRILYVLVSKNGWCSRRNSCMLTRHVSVIR